MDVGFTQSPLALLFPNSFLTRTFHLTWVLWLVTSTCNLTILQADIFGHWHYDLHIWDFSFQKGGIRGVLRVSGFHKLDKL